jgi:hypothetical protein
MHADARRMNMLDGLGYLQQLKKYVSSGHETVIRLTRPSTSPAERFDVRLHSCRVPFSPCA